MFPFLAINPIIYLSGMENPYQIPIREEGEKRGGKVYPVCNLFGIKKRRLK